MKESPNLEGILSDLFIDEYDSVFNDFPVNDQIHILEAFLKMIVFWEKVEYSDSLIWPPEIEEIYNSELLGKYRNRLANANKLLLYKFFCSNPWRWILYRDLLYKYGTASKYNIPEYSTDLKVVLSMPALTFSIKFFLSTKKQMLFVTSDPEISEDDKIESLTGEQKQELNKKMLIEIIFTRLASKQYMDAIYLKEFKNFIAHNNSKLIPWKKAEVQIIKFIELLISNGLYALNEEDFYDAILNNFRPDLNARKNTKNDKYLRKNLQTTHNKAYINSGEIEKIFNNCLKEFNYESTII